MFPYIYIPALGPIQPFGLLVAVGIIAGAWAGKRQAEKTGLSVDEMRILAGWCMIVGFVFSHVFDVFVYEFDAFKEDWTRLPKIWVGISSFGGLIGGGLGFLWFVKKVSGQTPRTKAGQERHLETQVVVNKFSLRYPAKKFKLFYVDACAVGALVGWVFGRMACAVVHNHIGTPASEPWGVVFPVGNGSHVVPGRFHDLGLYEFLYLVPLCLLTLWLVRKPKRPGWVLAFFMCTYTPPRFFLEFLRLESSDPRYAGLTPAQWACIGGFLGGIYLFYYIFTKGEKALDQYHEVGLQDQPLSKADFKTYAPAAHAGSEASARVVEGASNRSSDRAKPRQRNKKKKGKKK